MWESQVSIGVGLAEERRGAGRLTGSDAASLVHAVRAGGSASRAGGFYVGSLL